MFSIQDFSIISTKCDSLLFFSSSYQGAVLEAINKIMDRVDFDINNSKKLQLCCHDEFILIQDKRVEPEVLEIEFLSSYEPTEDLESFTLGFIQV